MSLDQHIRDSLVLPAICAPMFLVSYPKLVTAACKAGLIGGLPRGNARSTEEFAGWLKDIREELDAYKEANPNARVGPIAVNLGTRMKDDEAKTYGELCNRYGVEIIITAAGDPTEAIKHVHGWGGKVWHDATSIRFAEKAIKAGADGITAIGAGGGGHSGTISHLALIPQIREMFDGTIVLAGCVSNGATIRAAEILGADLAYMGTRFIATQESGAPDEYRELLVSQGPTDLMYTGAIAGVPANWMLESMRRVGLDPKNLPKPTKPMGRDHLPEDVKPWKNLWSAGQGIGIIHDVPTVAELVHRLREEYIAACGISDMTAAAK